MSALWKRAAFNLTESEIRWAMQHSTTVSEAARFLKIKYHTFKKYAEMYYDKETGLNLYQAFRRKKRSTKSGGVNMTYSPWNCPMEEILSGKRPNYRLDKLQARLIVEGILLEQCNICGYHERRITDYAVPLKLSFLNGNTTDHRLENMELVCYNCFFLYYGELLSKKYRVNIELYKRERNMVK